MMNTIYFQTWPSGHCSSTSQVKKRGIFPMLRGDIDVYMERRGEAEKPNILLLGFHHWVRNTGVASHSGITTAQLHLVHESHGRAHTFIFCPWPCELRTVDPIDIRDMKSLPNSIAHEFQSEGHWVLSKTGNMFSAIPFDQAHEQENKVVKSAGGAVGLTENPLAFRWIKK